MPSPERAFRSAVLAALVAAVTALPPGARGGEPAAGFQLTVLGIAQDGGVPHLGCDRDCCRLAREKGTVLHPACLGIRDLASGRLVLVEATPAVETQIAAWHAATGLTRGREPVDAVLLTHAHIGHYLGLAQFGREVASTRNLPVHVSARMADYLRGNGPWSQLVALEQVDLRVFTPGLAFQPVEGLTVVAHPVPHRDEFSDTMAFTIQGPRAAVLFVPDVDGWDREPGLLDSLLTGVDTAYLDATFYDGRELPGRNVKEIPHPLMVDTMERLAGRARARPGSIRFIHLNHTNPALWDAGIRAEIESRGFRIASEGETVDL